MSFELFLVLMPSALLSIDWLVVVVVIVLIVSPSLSHGLVIIFTVVFLCPRPHPHHCVWESLATIFKPEHECLRVLISLNLKQEPCLDLCASGGKDGVTLLWDLAQARCIRFARHPTRLVDWETLEDDKSEMCLSSVKPACPTSMLSLLALSAPTLAKRKFTNSRLASHARSASFRKLKSPRAFKTLSPSTIPSSTFPPHCLLWHLLHHRHLPFSSRSSNIPYITNSIRWFPTHSSTPIGFGVGSGSGIGSGSGGAQGGVGIGNGVSSSFGYGGGRTDTGGGDDSDGGSRRGGECFAGIGY
ncbi:hypothetical protein glysoja_045903 [Glycine soja]|uniref:Uncharacterized protein n=1 Tax=Glycine soja TaxID=3848 RepID=A0A0B2QXT6_GLYSO|nr:hypothetical protein glysoja_045903 [Glycine soja]